MKQSFTQQHLVKFLYRETSTSEMLSVNEALHQDPVLRQEYDQLMQAQQQLPRVQFRPAAASIHRILKYSECSSVGREA